MNKMIYMLSIPFLIVAGDASEPPETEASTQMAPMSGEMTIGTISIVAGDGSSITLDDGTTYLIPDQDDREIVQGWISPATLTIVPGENNMVMITNTTANSKAVKGMLQTSEMEQ